MESFADFFWFMIITFLWVAWILVLIRVFADIFRSDSSGWAKAGWTIFVIVLPFLGVLVYLIAQGADMAQRDLSSAAAMERAQRDYIREVAGGSGSAADDLEKLAALKDRGVLTEDEFSQYKAKLLA